MTRVIAALVAGAWAFGTWGDTPYPLGADGGTANRARVEAFRANAYWKDAPFGVAVVEALSDIPRTPERFPEGGDFTGPVRTIAAKGEFESASLVLFGFEDIGDVLAVPSELRTAGGDVLPASVVDVKVVKVWYQQGSAWYSYFSETQFRKPVPELLLHDETLVKTDYGRQENIVRCDLGSRTIYKWISFGPESVDHSWDGVWMKGVRDADALSPFVLQKNAFKQLMLTVHVPRTARAGLYAGEIALTVGGKRACGVPLQVRVLPFALPRPATFRDPDRRFIVGGYTHTDADKFDHPKIWRDLAEHNLLNPLLPQISTVEQAQRYKRLFESTGIDTEYLFCTLPPCSLLTEYPPQESDRDYQKFGETVAGFSNSVAIIRQVFGERAKPFSYGVDEGDARTIRSERAAWREVHRACGCTIVATRYHPYLLFNLDFANIPMQPRTKRAQFAEALHGANSEAIVAWYSDPHSGPENPSFARRVYGWQTWRSNYDAIMQYVIYRDNWNDFFYPPEPYLRGLMLTYRTDDAMIDTLQWEGFREGVDDIRYGTCLKRLALRCREAKDVDVQYSGRAAATWLAQVDCLRGDLGTLRLETIRRILALRTALGLEEE